jgi:iron-sulfur cluster insertion protein
MDRTNQNELIIDQSAIARVQHLRTQKNDPHLHLRVMVEGGGCSGFQYQLDLVTDMKDDDLVYHDTVITDEVSLPFLMGSTVRFEESLIGAEFKIDNPNAKMGCGCGTSFSV